MCRERADPDHVALTGNASQLRDPSDVDQGGRRGQAQLQQRYKAVTAGEELRARVRGEELMRVRHGARAVVVEVRCIHGLSRSRDAKADYAPFLACAPIARQTRSGVSGIWSDPTPKGCRASITAL